MGLLTSWRVTPRDCRENILDHLSTSNKENNLMYALANGLEDSLVETSNGSISSDNGKYKVKASKEGMAILWMTPSEIVNKLF